LPGDNLSTDWHTFQAVSSSENQHLYPPILFLNLLFEVTFKIKSFHHAVFFCETTGVIEQIVSHFINRENCIIAVNATIDQTGYTTD